MVSAVRCVRRGANVSRRLWVVLSIVAGLCSERSLWHLPLARAEDAVDGEDINPEEFPWFTGIFDAQTGEFQCGGAFIGNRYVLTANHCIENLLPLRNIFVEVGYLCQRREDNCGRTRDTIGIVDWKPHVDGGDLVILTLARSVTPRIVPAIPYLGPSIHQFHAPLEPGQEMTIVGGGLVARGGISFTVKKIRVNYLPLKECREELSTTALNDDLDICSTAADILNPCDGDSGSAVIVPGTGIWEGRDVIVAIHRLGPTNCENPRKKVFGHFRLSNASPLIREVVCQSCSGDFSQDWCEVHDRFRWLAAIRTSDDLSFRCTASLIGSRYVTTAAHCMEGLLNIVVEVGHFCHERDNCGRPNEFFGLEDVPLIELNRHVGGDMVLVTLSRPVTINIQPAVPYLGPSIHPTQPRVGNDDDLSLIVYNRNPLDPFLSLDVEEVKLKRVKRKKCRKQVSRKEFVTKHIMCSRPTKKQTACLGDSGGAVVVRGVGRFTGRDVMVGIHNFGPRDCSDTHILLGHFQTKDAAEVLQTAICLGEHPEDWC